MSDIAVRTIGLGKMYRIGGEREKYRTLRDTMVQAAKRPIERIRRPLDCHVPDNALTRREEHARV